MHVRFIKSQSVSRVFAIGFAISAVLTAGCYTHVVRVTGPGSSAYEVYEPNMQTPEQERRNAEAEARKAAPEEKKKD